MVVEIDFVKLHLPHCSAPDGTEREVNWPGLASSTIVDAFKINVGWGEDVGGVGLQSVVVTTSQDEGSDLLCGSLSFLILLPGLSNV